MQNVDYFMIITGLITLLISFYLDNFFFELFKKTKKQEIHSKLLKLFSVISNTFFIALVFAIVSYVVFIEKNNFGLGQDALLFLCIGISGILVLTYFIKVVVARSRPIAKMYIPLTHLNDYSFPSSHSAFVFGVLALIHDELYITKTLWLMFAILVAISRIYLEKHYLSDVAAGALLGYFAGMVALRTKDINLIIISTVIIFFIMLLLGKMFKKRETYAEKNNSEVKEIIKN